MESYCLYCFRGRSLAFLIIQRFIYFVCVHWYFTPLYCWVVFHWMDISKFGYQASADGLWIIQFEAFTNKADITIYVHIFLWTCPFICFRQIPRIGMVGSHGWCIFSFLRYYQILFQNGVPFHVTTNSEWEL